MYSLEKSGFELRCLAYTSQATHSWSVPALHSLANQALDRNLALGVTGRLMYLRGRFIQVLEGPGLTAQDLYRRIQHDARHTDVTQLINAEIKQRTFQGWTMELLLEEDLTPGQPDGLLKLITPTPAPTGSRWNDVLGLIRSIERSGDAEAAKVAPQQSRALATIERLVQAAQRLMISGRFASANMQAVAAEANVSVPTAYRYFSSPDQLVAHVIKRWQARQMATFAHRLAVVEVDSAKGLAGEIVTYVVATYMRNDLVPLSIRTAALRTHQRIAYAELWDLAAVVGDSLRRNGMPAGDSEQQGRIAMALAGLAAKAKMAALQQPALMETAWFRTTMTEELAKAMCG